MDNMRGSAFMVLAMAAFSLEDMFIKSAARTLPVGEILILFGLGGMLVFMLLTRRRNEVIFHPAILSRPILLRALSEVAGRMFFTLALAVAPLSSVSAILQATPLVVVMGAALLFGERVGWRRWSAILVGFLGVLLIIRPGTQAFEASSLLAVAGMLGFAGRDLATRAAPPVLSNMQLGVYGFFVLIPVGFGLLLYSGGGSGLTLESALQIAGATVFGVIAYYSLTVAMRTGEVSVVTPFRYTRLVFALILGAIIFAERPDTLTLVGSAIIVSSGIYTLLRNRRPDLKTPDDQ
ncbi:MAG: Membrane protein, putative [uncultured Thiotrichaceae bacterium]|uniref:Membrane protein, putative n=1 Tax=uncultured Thiotrichaceae bacterium TaxID=298394 RepID=A0A6S6TN84_9GAMM|nr:MAG: Membrane protein, putative [uncultured Thiotrichaceae bacterium]